MADMADMNCSDNLFSYDPPMIRWCTLEKDDRRGIVFVGARFFVLVLTRSRETRYNYLTKLSQQIGNITVPDFGSG